MKPILLLPAFLLLCSCGFKGNLYLPKENDDARFGVIQTGIGQPFEKPADSPKQP
ncbi:LPS translocon maturation chaperone LptM [Neisseria musculi]